MSLHEALVRCFEDEPYRIFGIQDLCDVVQQYYDFSEFQKELDPKHPQPRYEHEIRSLIARLTKERHVDRLGRNQYRLAQN
jgi:hypothetical protein